MNTGKKIAILAFAISIPFLFSPSKSFSLSCMESLKGLEGVEVLIEELKPDLEDFNLTMIQIQADVELKLRMGGIEVLSKEENEKIQPLRKPYLYIKINSYKMPRRKGSFAFNIEIALNQQVVLREHSTFLKKPFYAPTWYTSFVGAVSGEKVPEIRDVVKDLTDKFINAYLTANPKK
jgi:hypothetical protein